MSSATDTIRIEAARRIAAPADTVYQIIADYRQHHPNILPPAFSDLSVESGGVGSGTVVAFKLKAGGQTQRYRARVEEPEPGRVLHEIDLARDSVTSFEVRPQGNEAEVRIVTELQPSRGVRGWMERRFAPRMLKPIYEEELTLLDRYARQHSGVSA